MLLRRVIISGYSRFYTSRPIAWAVKEFYSDGTFRFLLSFRKTYNFNCLFFDSYSELERYATSKGLI